MVMATKTISITEEAYDALVREKIDKESFTETILRLTKKTGKLADCFGTWEMTDKEQENIEAILAEGWQRTQERLVNELPRH